MADLRIVLPALRRALREHLPGKRNAYLRMALRNAAENAAAYHRRNGYRLSGLASSMLCMHRDRPELTSAVVRALTAAIAQDQDVVMRATPPPDSGPGAPPAEWARRAAAGMTDEEVRRFLAQNGHALPTRDTRSPIERMIDEACGVQSKSPKETL